MIKNLNGFSGIDPTFAKQVAYQLFFLRINADDRMTLLLIGRL